MLRKIKEMTRFSLFAVLLLLVSCSANNDKKVKLVLQLTVDQLRGDVLDYYKQNFTKNGFFYLINNGRNYTDAHYIHSMTKTAPGHSTLSTGATPSVHGIVNNDWYSQKLKTQVYSCEDNSSPILGDIHEGGKSPRFLMASTLGDEMVSANPNSKVFGVSIKDRGSILMAGHKGKAFWFSKQLGDFITSEYYYNDYPSWISKWREKNPIDEYYKKGWDLLLPKDKYIYGNKDENNYEKSIPELGFTFPHNFGDMTKDRFYSLLPYSPWGDKLTAEFAKELIENEKLGQDENTDYLSISFSCTDYIGHLFGPKTLEYEDQIINLDRTLSDLFSFIDEKIGLDNVVIVLSGDHGVCEAPELLKEEGIETGVLSMKDLVVKLNNYGKKKFKFNFDAVLHIVPPYIYLNVDNIEASGIELCELEKEFSKVSLDISGVYRTYTDCEIADSTYPGDEVFQKIKNSYYPDRSGNLYVINKPNWYLAYNPKTRKNAATHGSPWSYDTFVPLIFEGPEIKPAKLSEKAGPHQIAPTLAKYLGIKKPSGAKAEPLF